MCGVPAHDVHRSTEQAAPERDPETQQAIERDRHGQAHEQLMKLPRRRGREVRQLAAHALELGAGSGGGGLLLLAVPCSCGRSGSGALEVRSESAAFGARRLQLGVQPLACSLERVPLERQTLDLAA